MADTRQIVKWALERKCSFRSGDQWFLPDQTCNQLRTLRTVAGAASDGRNVDGICVTSYTTCRDNAGKSHRIPHSGFRIEEDLGSFGGLSVAVSQCGSCEANAKAELEIPVAGCFGNLDVWPDSEELDKQLWAIIKKSDLEQRLRSAFPVTTPLWYGLWINSPIQREQAEFLHVLLNAACDDNDPKDKDIRHFLNGLAAAIRYGLPVHVTLAPLGHTDFGWYTVFPHCPRCKANAPVGRWKSDYPTTPHMCRACGHMFNPNAHQSSQRDDVDWNANSLVKQMGEKGFEQFVKRFLGHEGCSPDQADEIIDISNNGPLIRRIKSVRTKRNETLLRLRQHTKPSSDVTTSSTVSYALADHLEIELVLAPAGEFKMGSSSEQENKTALPRHLVRIAHPFFIGRYPVTQAQWTAVMSKNCSIYQGNPNLPVDQVSWFDCQEFCERLCQRFGRMFRLPSEAEWEYACRGGTTTKYAFGETLLPTHANFTPHADRFGPLAKDKNSVIRQMELAADPAALKIKRNAKPTPVGSYPPNAWGIYDMHGNVDEWCEDVWHPNYEGAPNDGSPWLDGEEREPFRVMRGGFCSATEHVCTSSFRRQRRADAGTARDHDPHDGKKTDEFMATMFNMLYTPYGFRVVCEIPGSQTQGCQA
jgi:formylglycine-generating enzyme required for sulfatase activity